MNKAEALAVLHEILDACNDSLTINSVSIDSFSSLICKTPVGCQIKMKCDLNDHSRTCIQPIIEKRNLKIDVIKGAVLIYSP